MLAKIMCLTLLLAAAGTPAVAQSNWFTVAGDPDDLKLNIVQVDPIFQDQDPHTMRVRVNRSTRRTSWDGVPYRSYEANVLFDCRKNSARYLSITYYAQPGWKGDARTVDYATGPGRFMEFREVHPNPHERITSAACGRRESKR